MVPVTPRKNRRQVEDGVVNGVEGDAEVEDDMNLEQTSNGEDREENVIGDL